eukprot:scaffold1098_cov417-Prasinococcus_capsulatus_cf.AAC.2
MKPSRQGGGSGFYSVDKFLVPRLEEVGKGKRHAVSATLVLFLSSIHRKAAYCLTLVVCKCLAVSAELGIRRRR